MKDIVVLCPSRGRPDKAAEMLTSFRETAVLLATEMVLVVDEDDPTLEGYLALPSQFTVPRHGPLAPPNPPRIMILKPNETGNLTAATNTAAARIWDDDIIIGHVGDDHRFRSESWDKRISETLTETGVAYGDDGHWGQTLPTAAFLTSDIPRALGWYALPLSRHYGIDDAWGDIGRDLGCLHYLPDVKIIQPGPEQTAANGDAIFWKAQEHRSADADAFFNWRDNGGREADITRVRPLLLGPSDELIAHANAWGDMAPHVRQLTEFASKAKVIVEWGVRAGVSSWAFLDGLPPDGRLIGVDIEPNSPIHPHVAEDPRFTFICGNDLEVPIPDDIDILMIDSSHEYEQTRMELLRAESLRVPLILLHDYLYEDTPGVREAVNLFVRAGSYRLDRVYESKWGLAVLVPR